MKIVKTISIVVSLVWLGVLFLWSGMTLNAIGWKQIASNWSIGTNMTANVRADLLGKIWHKDEFIDINGGWARAVGKRYCNDILKLRNGHLTEIARKMPTDIPAARLNGLSDFCESYGIPCVSVMMPYKADLGNSIFPSGAPRDFANENADSFLSKLNCKHVVDTRKLVAATAEDINRNFFKTDHHWNFSGAFKAYVAIAKKMLEVLGEQESVPQLDVENWQVRDAGRPFLGSSGRRTGRFFAGMDKLEYYVPKFKTDMVGVVGRKNLIARGPFEEAMIFSRNVKTPPSWQLDMGYCVYGSDFPEYTIYNAEAPVDKRVFIVKDSFAIPVYAFLSTVFREIQVCDLRGRNGMSVVERIATTRPDIVCVMYNPRALTPKPFFEFGEVESYGKDALVSIPCEDQIEILAKNIQYNHVPMADLAPGTTLFLTIDRIQRLQGDCDQVSVCVYDYASKKTVARENLVADAAFRQAVRLNTPTADGQYRLLLYAGPAGKTAGNSILASGIKVSRAESAAR